MVLNLQIRQNTISSTLVAPIQFLDVDFYIVFISFSC